MLFMYAIATAMLTMPGLVALYIHRGGVKVTRENWPELLVEYLIFSFLILVLDYGFMFISNPQRTVSFSLSLMADSNLLSAGFIFKYSFMALLFAVALPYVYRCRVIVKKWYLRAATWVQYRIQKNVLDRKNEQNNKPIR